MEGDAVFPNVFSIGQGDASLGEDWPFDNRRACYRQILALIVGIRNKFELLQFLKASSVAFHQIQTQESKFLLRAGTPGNLDFRERTPSL